MLLGIREFRSDDLEHQSTADPDFSAFDLALPLFFDSRSGSTLKAPHLSDSRTVADIRLRDRSRLAQNLFWLGALGLAALAWLAHNIVGLNKLRNIYNAHIQIGEPGLLSGDVVSAGFFRFITTNLDSLTRKLLATARQQYQVVLEKEREHIASLRESDELQRLRNRLERYRQSDDVTPGDAERIDQALANANMEQIRGLVNDLDTRISEKLAESMQREIKNRAIERTAHRIQAEFEGLPAEKLQNEARDAWDLYQRAQAERDVITRLKLLKEARKKIPKVLRPERF